MGQKWGEFVSHTTLSAKKKGERRHSQVSVLCVMQGRSERAQMGNQNDWITESLKKQDKCHYQFRLSCFLTFVYSQRGFSGSSLFVC